MTRRITFIIISIVLVGLLVYSYVHFSNLKNFKNNQTIQAIPTDASLIIQVQKPSRVSNIILNGISYNEPLLKFHWFKSFFTFLKEAQGDTLILNEHISHFIKSKPITISLHPLGKDDVKPLFTYSISNKAQENGFINYLEENPDKWIIHKRKYNTSTIYSIKPTGIKTELYVSFYRGLLMISPSSLLIENALRQLRSDFSLMSDKTFAKLFKTIGNNSDANLFINFNNIAHTLSKAFSPAHKKKLSFLSHIASWGEFDLTLNDTHILSNGFLYTDENQTKINALFKDIDPGSTKINEVIPDNASFVQSYSFDDNEQLRINLKSYLQKNGSYQAVQSNYKNLDLKDPLESTQQKVFNIIDKEFSYIVNNDTENNHNSYLIVRTKSKSKTMKLLTNLLNSDIEPITYYQLDQQVKYPIYQSKAAQVFPTLLSPFCPEPPQKYFTFVDNYLVFSNSTQKLSDLIYAHILNKTLGNSKYHQDFTDMFSYKQNMFVYCDISKIKSLLPGASHLTLLNPTRTQQESLNQFYGLGIQLTTAANYLIYLNACVHYMPMRESEPETVWQSGLDSTIIGKPALVINHYTKEKEIMVQDKSNMLYLLSNSGRVLWKKKLDAQIKGEVTQIDFYRNNKLQYIFNTENRIYLLDRNGNNVEKYPIDLAHKATNSIAVFDYDKNRNYRIFVACANRKTYVFDKYGRKITGWKAKATEGQVSQPIQHIRALKKDYIVFADDKRNYILNRKGENRVLIQSDFVRNENSLFYLLLENNIPSLVTTDTNGNLRKINLNTGECKMTKLLHSKEDHHFIARDITKDKGVEYIIVTRKEVYTYKANSKKLFEVQIDGDLLPTADSYLFSSNNKKIGVFDKENNKIYLINSNGTIYKNFPLRGNQDSV
ncbi:DUF3352 domain-containing protein [Saccharicrinis fermentans]|uniref:Uncharacterized protein n=1 Tax=Saccharicrinis fermentans DSM 9555 = JCM 21142 TaxID=869213 RepID=W7XVY2_9BACT|nr:DUF3352 domain-containing protein [Saccharicrinis fermentans]GAF02405.1 hypothetical protein JCM21142_31039 [Saccharicrinis fermentans DSM 9555 = JCM 21142]